MERVCSSKDVVENIGTRTLSSLLPWNCSSGALFGLWDMKDFYAHYFFIVARELNAILFMEGLVSLTPAPWVIPPGKSLEIMQRLAVLLQHLGNDDLGGDDFGVVWTLVNSLSTKLSTNDKFTYKELLDEVGAIEKNLQASLMRLHAMYVPAADVKYYTDTEPFGPVVAKKFHAFNRDITEAARCLAFDRTTAVVFHLMRVMEHAVLQLGKNKLGVKIDPQRSEWGGILKDMNEALYPTKGTSPVKVFSKAQKERYSEAIALLGNVKNAWRNKTMHPRVKGYTKSEAKDVFDSVRMYLIYLATMK